MTRGYRVSYFGLHKYISQMISDLKLIAYVLSGREKNDNALYTSYDVCNFHTNTHRQFEKRLQFQHNYLQTLQKCTTQHHFLYFDKQCCIW